MDSDKEHSFYIPHLYIEFKTVSVCKSQGGIFTMIHNSLRCQKMSLYGKVLGATMMNGVP